MSKRTKYINVKDCNNCPFMNVQYDDFAIDCNTTKSCNLAEYYNYEDYLIDVGADMMDTVEETPKWCPLKDVDYKIKMNKLDI